MPGSEPEHGPQPQVDLTLPGSLPSVGAESPELFFQDLFDSHDFPVLGPHISA